MEIKQLVKGDPKTGFVPITQDTIVVVELNEAVLNITSSSSSADIIAAFDSVAKFDKLIADIRVKENIMNGVLINNDTKGGNINASIVADKGSDKIELSFIYNNIYSNIVVTKSGGTFSCVRRDKNLFA